MGWTVPRRPRLAWTRRSSDPLDQCYGAAVALLRDNLEDMAKVVVAYLLEKETITGGEMVAIIEGRDPTQVEDAYASTRAVPQGDEPPARKIRYL